MTLLIFLGFLTFIGCGDPNVGPDPVDETAVDTTTTLRNVTETGGYSTFYKPQTGFVGDPMPYYNASDQSYYLFFLQDWRNGAPTDHPIYVTKTTDYAKFNGFTEAIPCGIPGGAQTLPTK